jgi:hypothetical protein
MSAISALFGKALGHEEIAHIQPLRYYFFLFGSQGQTYACCRNEDGRISVIDLGDQSSVSSRLTQNQLELEDIETNEDKEVMYEVD